MGWSDYCSDEAGGYLGFRYGGFECMVFLYVRVVSF